MSMKIGQSRHHRRHHHLTCVDEQRHGSSWCGSYSLRCRGFVFCGSIEWNRKDSYLGGWTNVAEALVKFV